MARYADIDVLLEHLTTSDEGNFRTAITQWLEMHQVEDVAPIIHAHWIEYETAFECSNCRDFFPCTMPYCPDCGAKMDEG